jgi:hypothetical protein
MRTSPQALRTIWLRRTRLVTGWTAVLAVAVTLLIAAAAGSASPPKRPAAPAIVASSQQGRHGLRSKASAPRRMRPRGQPVRVPSKPAHHRLAKATTTRGHVTRKAPAPAPVAAPPAAPAVVVSGGS